MPELQGVISKLDIVLYDIVKLNSTSTAGTYNFFSQSMASVGKQRAVLLQPNLIPENWRSFTIHSVGMKILDLVEASDFLTFVANSYYTFKIADYEIKSGHLSEFFNVSWFSLTDGNYDGVQSDMPSNLYVSLMKPITLEPLISFNFVVEVKVDVAGMRDKYIGLYFKGTLDRSIVG